MWVARNVDGSLRMFITKPNRIDEGCFQFWEGTSNDCDCKIGYKTDNNLFPNLGWKDEPIEVVVDEKQKLITRFEILHLNYDMSSKKFFSENPNKSYISFDEYALTNWDKVNMNFFNEIG